MEGTKTAAESEAP